jgi:hypothetical protein
VSRTVVESQGILDKLGVERRVSEASRRHAEGVEIEYSLVV